MNRRFFSEVVYSAANEDSASELAALSLSPKDRALCITGSGARALDLLIGDPGRVTSIDFNPAQTALLELKTASMRRLGRTDFLGFSGVTDSWSGAERLELYEALSPELSAPSLAFWQPRRVAIAKGVIYCGRWEKYLRSMARGAVFRRRQLKRLMDAPTLADQQESWRSAWDGKTWRFMLKVLGQRAVWRYVIREPGIALVPDDMDIGDYLYDCFDRGARDVLLRESPFVSLMFLGSYRQDGPLPLHMEEEHYETVKARLDRIEPVTASLTDYLDLEESKDAFDAFSLSDFSSYAPPHVYATIWQGVARAGRQGARVCERQFLVKADPTPLTHGTLSRNGDLEARLARTDNTLIYSFVCGILGFPQ